MDTASMLRTATVLLILTGLGGLVMGALRAKRVLMPDWLAMGHGFMAAAGLTLLIYLAATAGLAPLMWVGLGLLAAAAAGGVFLNLRYQAQRLPLPVRIIVAHGLLAVAGLFLIALGAFEGAAAAR